MHSHKNILLLIDSLGSGGAQNQITLWAEVLKKAGNKVSIFAYYDEAFFNWRLEKNNIELIFCQKKGKIGFNVILFLKQLISENNFDVIISFLDTPNFYASLAVKLSKKRPPLIVSYRSKTDFEKMSFLNLIVKKWVNNVATKIVSNAYHERIRWTQKFPMLTDKWTTIYNLLDHDKYIPKIKEIQNTYLIIGSIGPAKNGLGVIEALHILKEQGTKIFIQWIGEKVYHLVDRRMYLEKMEAKIIQYELQNQWQWIDPVQNIEEFYNTSKALIHASTTEGLPNVVCEALCCALPCIISNTLDHPRLVQNGIEGYLFDPFDPNSLAEAISRFEQKTNEEIQKMKKAAYQKSEKLFSTEILSEKINDLILSVCSNE